MVECARSEGGAVAGWGECVICGDGGSGVVSDIGFGTDEILVDDIGAISCAHTPIVLIFIEIFVGVNTSLLRERSIATLGRCVEC